MVMQHDDDYIPVRFTALFKENFLQTISYCSVFWSFGMCAAFLGPTLLDLGCRIQSVVGTMSWAFFSQSLFTLIGSAVGGYLVQKWSNNLVLLVSTLLICVTLSLIPACGVLLSLVVVLAVMGMGMGIIDTVANISMIQLYGRNVAPFMQALHFFYGLGAFLSPMIAEPFLMNEDCTNDIKNSTETKPSHQLDLTSSNLTTKIETNSRTDHNPSIQYAFWILAAIQTPVICLLLYLVIRDFFDETVVFEKPPPRPPPLSEDEDNIPIRTDLEINRQKNYSSSSDAAGEGGDHYDNTFRDWDDDTRPPVSRRQIFVITALTAALLFIYDGLQVGYGGYVFSYGVKSIAGMTMNEAAYLNACFWGTFAFGRLISIGLATKLSPSFMLFCNIVGSLFAMTLMLSFRHSHAVLYIGTCIFGMFVSSVFPTTVSLAESYIKITSSITSFLVIGAATGEIVTTVVIGHEFDLVSPVFLIIAGVCMTLVSLGVYCALYHYGETILRQSYWKKLGSFLSLEPETKPNKYDM